MSTYRVEYRIEIEADTPEEAAQEAQRCCLEPTWGERIWTVTSEDGEEQDVYVDVESGEIVGA